MLFVKVVFVIGSLERGGSERQMVNLAIGLRERGHSVSIALLDRFGELEPEAQQGSVALHRLYDGAKFPGHSLLRLARLLRHQRPDVVHPYLPRDNALVTLLKPFLRGALLVWGVRASDMDLTKYSRSTRLLWPFVVRASRFADLIIANSQAGARYHAAVGYPENMMAVIPNGIDTERFRPDPELGRQFRKESGIPEDAPVVGMLGRFDPMKGHDEFPAIFARVVHEVPDAYALVVGLHSEQQGHRFQQRCSDLRVADRVVLRQQTPTPEAMLNAIDVLALPSLSEGFPNVVAEAMACGKPVVAYDVGDVVALAATLSTAVTRSDSQAFVAGLSDHLRTPPSPESLRAAVLDRFSTVSLVDETLMIVDRTLRRTAVR